MTLVRCPVCARAYFYDIVRPDFGCSPECRADWTYRQVVVAPPRTGERVRISTPGLPLDGHEGFVVSSSPLLVALDEDPGRHLGFGASALEVLS